MAPAFIVEGIAAITARATSTTPVFSINKTVETWIEGYTLGGLEVLILIVICNMRRNVLLHKLILLEVYPPKLSVTVVLLTDLISICSAFPSPSCALRPAASMDGTSFVSVGIRSLTDQVVLRYTATSAIFIYIGYTLHNWIAWMKIRPFLSPRQNKIFVISLIVVAHPFLAWNAWNAFVRFVPLPQFQDNYFYSRTLETFARFATTRI